MKLFLGILLLCFIHSCVGICNGTTDIFQNTRPFPVREQSFTGYFPILDATGPVTVFLTTFVYYGQLTLEDLGADCIVHANSTLFDQQYTAHSPTIEWQAVVTAPTIIKISQINNSPGWDISFSAKNCDNTCNYNGYCYNGVCHCKKGWEGDDCELRGCEYDCSGVGTCAYDLSRWNQYCSCPAEYLGINCQCSASDMNITKDVTNSPVSNANAAAGVVTNYYFNDMAYHFGWTITLRTVSPSQVTFSLYDFQKLAQFNGCAPNQNYPFNTLSTASSRYYTQKYFCRPPPTRRNDTIISVIAQNALSYDLEITEVPDDRYIYKLSPGVAVNNVVFPAPWFQNYSIDIPQDQRSQALRITVTYSSPLPQDFTYGRIEIGNFSCVAYYWMLKAPLLTQNSEPKNVQSVILNPPYTQDTYWIMVWLDPGNNRNEVSRSITYNIIAEFVSPTTGTGSATTATTGTVNTGQSSTSASSTSGSGTSSGGSSTSPSETSTTGEPGQSGAIGTQLSLGMLALCIVLSLFRTI